MRLMQYGKDGVFDTPTTFNDGDTIPPYAILSHTWAVASDEEVTFGDLVRGTGEAKPGYQKLQFCGKQAQRDGLQYFWIDTCCIDKENKAELSLAIRSMFRWYCNAARCYVYLPDVSGRPCEPNGEAEMSRWELDFRKSRWFTRGWTLQELLAPSSVEFFSKEGQRLGDKISLIQEVHEATSIPYSALRGGFLSDFSVNERISWNEHRTTKLPVDRAYSLMGILGVSITPFEGEGPAEALRRLTTEVDKQSKCLQDLYITNPFDDKKRIEETKGGLLEDSYRWILNNATFQQWRTGSNQLLWIKGDPGKGKTMLLCGIVDELQHSMAKTALLSYFFCQSTDSRINSAVAVLRGLLYLLVNQQPFLIAHIYKRYDRVGKALFEDTNAWEALTGIFADVLRDPNVNTAYLIVDALDECVTDLPKLLSFITVQSSTSTCVKWIISSRNWPDIEEKLETAGRLSLELNRQSVATAVNIFIEQRVSQLVQLKKYDESTRSIILKHLTSNADNTFLWVALVCQDLMATPKRNVLKKLASFPPGLNSLYKRILQQVSESDEAETCKQVLASTAILYRPITIHELVALVEQLEDFVDDLDSVREIINLCGSFLTLRDDTVYFVHQSANDFIFTGAFNEIFPDGSEEVHRTVFSRSLLVLSRTLHRDMYNLKELGYPIEDVTPPESEALIAWHYPCVHWVDHLCDSQPSANYSLQIRGVVDRFLREKYLYWLEGVSLCKSMAKGVLSMGKLRSIVQDMQNADEFNELVQDAWRFILYHKGAIENTPLQTYESALSFSPTNSLIRRLFRHEELTWITIKPAMSGSWSTCLQTLEGHKRTVRSVSFSHDSIRLASGSDDGFVRIWDVNSGECLHTLHHGDESAYVAFSPNSTQLASFSGGGTVKIWDASDGKCLHTFEGYNTSYQIALSHDLTCMTSTLDDGTIDIWNINSGKCVQTLMGHNRRLERIAFSHDSARLASASFDNTVKIWDVGSGECLTTITHSIHEIMSLFFSPDSTRLVSATNGDGMHMWDVSSGVCLEMFYDSKISEDSTMTSGAFSHDSVRIAAGSSGGTIHTWNATGGTYTQTFKGHGGMVSWVVFSHDSTRLASASEDKTVKIWDASSQEGFVVESANRCESLVLSADSKLLALVFEQQEYVDIWDMNCDTLMHRLNAGKFIESITSSPNFRWLATTDRSPAVKVWDVISGECVLILRYQPCPFTLTFSPDSTMLATELWGSAIIIWDVESAECVQNFDSHNDPVLCAAFSHDSTWLASGSQDGIVKIWDVDNGECVQTFEGHSKCVDYVTFSYDSTRLASASQDKTVKIWDFDSGKCVQTFEGHSEDVEPIAFSHDSTRLASASFDNTVKIWDVDSGECLMTLNVDKKLHKISFDITGQKLQTEIGDIDISMLLGLVTAGHVSNQEPIFEGVAISPNREWITAGSRKLLWLPSEFRPSVSAVTKNMIVIGDGSGRLWIYRAGPREHRRRILLW